ncbi:MAG TPA: MATE family efflux transporter [Lachnospiraceae bacterium]|nr:MATE family efflux transporter [Lachnospiraceae bacterium]
MSSLSEKNTGEILNGSLQKAIVSLALPLVLNSIIQSMYNLTDTFWLGRLGTTEQAAISLVSPIQNIIINFGMGLTAAGSILLAGYIGEKKPEDAKDMANQLFVFNILLAVILGFLGIIFAPSAVDWLKAEGDVKPAAVTYLRIVLLDLPFLMTINTFASVMQAQGDTMTPTKLNFLGIVINMILDPVFMFVFGWGIAGAALATAGAKVPCALIALKLLSGKNVSIGLKLKGFRFNLKKIKRIFYIGLPIAFGNSTMQFGFLLMTKNVYLYGPAAMAAYGIGNKINSIITLPSSAMGNACTTIISQNIGAEQLDRAQKAYKTARKMCMIFLLVAGFIFSRRIVASAIVGIFTKDENVLKMGVDFLSIMAFFCFTNGLYDTTKAFFNGTSNTHYTMIIEVARLWLFRLGTVWVLINLLKMDEKGVWYSVAVSNAAAAVCLWLLYLAGVWKKRIESRKT